MGLLVGSWLSGQNHVKTVSKQDGDLFYQGDVRLCKDGDFMTAEMSSGTIRLKLGPSDDECIHQSRGKDSGDEWTEPTYWIRDGAVTAGTTLVTRHTTSIYESITDSGNLRASLGKVGAGNVVEAAGPPRQMAGEWRVVPIKPCGCVVMQAVRIQEDENSPWAEYIPGKTQAVQAEKYQQLSSIHEALNGHETILLKGRWMQTTAEAKGVLPRRQELPLEAQ